MKTAGSIILDEYILDAHERFDRTERELINTESNFRLALGGRTPGGILQSLVGTALWIGGIIAGAVYVRNLVYSPILIGTVAVTALLSVFMFAGGITDYLYYVKMYRNKDRFYVLRKRLYKGKDSIDAEQEVFAKSRANGWDLPLDVARSIPDEALSIATRMSGLKRFNSNFINKAKNILFFASVVGITASGCLALFPLVDNTVTTFAWSFSSDTLTVISIIALVLTMVGEVILAKIVWAKTDCEVTNLTLLSALAGPIGFLVLITVAGLVLALVAAVFMLVVSIILPIIGVLIAAACLLSTTSGGE